jgi:hypothetical protein
MTVISGILPVGRSGLGAGRLLKRREGTTVVPIGS